MVFTQDTIEEDLCSVVQDIRVPEKGGRYRGNRNGGAGLAAKGLA